MLGQGQGPEARTGLPRMSLIIEQRLVGEVLPIRPCVTLPHHLAVDVASVEVDLPQQAFVPVSAFGQHANLAPKHLLRQRLPRPGAPRLRAFRGVDFSQPETFLGRASVPFDKQGYGIAIRDADDDRIETGAGVAWVRDCEACR